MGQDLFVCPENKKKYNAQAQIVAIFDLFFFFKIHDAKMLAKKITSMDLNDKSISSLQANMSPKRHK